MTRGRCGQRAGKTTLYWERFTNSSQRSSLRIWLGTHAEYDELVRPLEGIAPNHGIQPRPKAAADTTVGKVHRGRLVDH